MMHQPLVVPLLLLLAGAVSADFAINDYTPHSKVVINGMAVVIRGHIVWNNWTSWSKVMGQFFDSNFTYDFVQPLGKTVGLWDWYNGEHLHYNYAFPNFTSFNFLFLGTDDSSCLQSYHVVRWQSAFGGVPAPPGKPLIKIKDMDFYTMKNDMIWYNWCMVDVIGILEQGGYAVLPEAPMPNGIDYLPPRAMDGIPAPDDQYATKEAADNARVVVTAMIHEDFVEQKHSAKWWSHDMMWCGPAGIGHARSRRDYIRHFLRPLHRAFSKPELTVNKFVCESNYCGVLYHIKAKHTGTWLGQPATGKVVQMRFGCHFRVENNRVVDGWTQIDIVDVFKQMGVDLLERAKKQYPRLVAEHSKKHQHAAKATSIELLEASPDMLETLEEDPADDDELDAKPALTWTLTVELNAKHALAFTLGSCLLCAFAFAYRSYSRSKAATSSSYVLLA